MQRGESYHKREGWDEEIGVKSGREGNKFFIIGSSGYYLDQRNANLLMTILIISFFSFQKFPSLN